MDHSHEAQASHYAAPPAYYPPPISSSAIIGPRPNPSFDQVQVQVPISVSQGVDASLTSPVGYTVSQYQADPYASYYASMSAASGGVGLAPAYIGSMPTVDPIHPVNKKKANHVVTAQDLESKKRKLIETGADANSVRTCTICNVVCNSDKVFAFHIASEKHISRVNGRPSKGLTQIFTSQQAVYSANASTPNKKPKKKKNNMLSAVKAPTVAQSVYCDVCKITCNTQEMYNNHVSGKKHNKNIKNLTAGDIPIQFVPARSTSPGTQTLGTNDNDKQFVYCDICKITCNTQEMYSNHVSGKKHNKNIKNLTMGDRPIQFVPATSTSPGTQTLATNDNDQEHVPSSSQMELKPKMKSKSVSKEDLETKKRKVLESGAKGDAVKVCDLCNIVVNDPKVFEYHCKGQKHTSMVKKQAEHLGGSAVAHDSVAPDVVSA
jgi:translation initiation factor IF-1